MNLASTDPVSHVSITKASLVATFTTVVGNVIALVPAWAPAESHIIQIGSFAIAGIWLAVNGIHAVAGAKRGPGESAQQEIARLVRGELKQILSSGILAEPPPVAAPVPETPPAA